MTEARQAAVTADTTGSKTMQGTDHALLEGLISCTLLSAARLRHMICSAVH